MIYEFINHDCSGAGWGSFALPVEVDAIVFEAFKIHPMTHHKTHADSTFLIPLSFTLDFLGGDHKNTPTK